jgi:flagellin-specific chaperone FliS
MGVKDRLTLIDLTDTINELQVSLNYDKDTIIYDATEGTYDVSSISIS